MVEEKTLIILGASGVVALMIIAVDFLLLSDVPTLFSSILVLALIVMIGPIGLIKYNELSRVKELEDMFPQFMNDLVETVRSGMTLPQAIQAIAQNDYGDLSFYVRKLSAQLDWGIPFGKAFLGFTRGTKSKLIGRIGSTIIESHDFGGNLTDIFESISKTTVEIERLREERKLYLNSQMISGYIIFFVFLVVLIGLQKFLVPTLSDISLGEISSEGVGETLLEPSRLIEDYKSIFRNLVVMQGLFAGLVIGKMAEGSAASGIKHSFILIATGVFIFTVSTL